MVEVGTGGIGSKFIKRDYPIPAESDEGTQTNLTPEESFVTSAESFGIGE